MSSPTSRTATTIHGDRTHLGWDRTVVPELEVDPGTTIGLQVLDASGGQMDPETPASVFLDWDASIGNPLTGPVKVRGAREGDALLVRIAGFETTGWGWTGVIPGFGLLADDFPQPELYHWTLEAGSRTTDFKGAARVPLRPFPGTLGVAPGEWGNHSSTPPRRVGGNLDVRDLVEGTTLCLPVEVDGALFSLGDTHAAQGDGEVCGTAIESPMTVFVTLDLQPGGAPAFPHFRTQGPPRGAEWEHGVLAATGVGPDLMAAARDAVRGMIEILDRERGLDPIDGYLLCSVASDLRISEIVDVPNFVVTCALPRGILS